MKLSLISTAAILALALPQIGHAQNSDPALPVGTLVVNPESVPVDTHPLMSWSITYPEKVHDIVSINAKSSLTTKRTTTMEIRVVGVAFQSGKTHLPVALWVRIGGASGSWVQLFNDKYTGVDPTQILYRVVLPADTQVDFAARGHYSSTYINSNGSDFRTTLSEDICVIGLANGASVPDYTPAYDQARIESYLTQFISPDNKVTIGPRDLIYLFEVGSRNPGSSAFDMQDIVTVVNFEEQRIKTNNGHGNNIDGVDLSNPGGSAENWYDNWGITDTSAPDDDEGDGGGSAISLDNSTP